MRLAIVGSREFQAIDWVANFVATLNPNTVINNGTARGVDSYAAGCANARGLQVKDFPAQWKLHGRRAGPIRNQLMLNESDWVAAFWDGQSSGTKDMLIRAVSSGKLWFVCLPSGTLFKGSDIGSDKQLLFNKVEAVLRFQNMHRKQSTVQPVWRGF